MWNKEAGFHDSILIDDFTDIRVLDSVELLGGGGLEAGILEERGSGIVLLLCCRRRTAPCWWSLVVGVATLVFLVDWIVAEQAAGDFSIMIDLLLLLGGLGTASV